MDSTALQSPRPSRPACNPSTAPGRRLGRLLRCWQPRAGPSVHEVAGCGFPCGVRSIIPLSCGSSFIVTRCCFDGIVLSPRLAEFLRSFYRRSEPCTLFPSCNGSFLAFFARPTKTVRKAPNPIPLSSVFLITSPIYQ